MISAACGSKITKFQIYLLLLVNKNLKYHLKIIFQTTKTKTKQEKFIIFEK